MKNKDELQPIIREIASDASPIGMDPVYVHALILDKLTEIEAVGGTRELRGTKPSPANARRDSN